MARPGRKILIPKTINMKMKLLALAICGLLSGSAIAQDVFSVESTKVKFFSEAPLENIEAVTTKSQALVNKASKSFAFIIPIKSFEFDKELMKEHFNENYMESGTHKTGSFKGKIIGDVDFGKPGKYEVEAKGILKIHGVEQERTIKAVLELTKNGFKIHSEFKVKLEDHKIEIPTVVFQNIAEVIDVTVDFAFIPKPKK